MASVELALDLAKRRDNLKSRRVRHLLCVEESLGQCRRVGPEQNDLEERRLWKAISGALARKVHQDW